jgi:hypothetical protein
VVGEPLLVRVLQFDNPCFKVLLDLLNPHAEMQNTRMRRAIGGKERLTETLRVLGTGRSFKNSKLTTIISPQTFGRVGSATCNFVCRC